jgi:hypothetical protein
MQYLTFSMWLQKLEHSAKKGFLNLVEMEIFSVHILSMSKQYSTRTCMYGIMLKKSMLGDFLGCGVCRFSLKLSQLNPLRGLTPVESAVILADCVHRGLCVECRSGPASCPA